MSEVLLKMGSFLGIDQSVNEGDISVSSSPDALNIDTGDGMLKASLGYSKYIAARAPAVPNSLIKYYKRSSTGDIKKHLLIGTDLGIFYYDTDTGSWSQIHSALGSGVYDFVNYQKDDEDIVIMTDGVERPQKWNGEGNTETLLGCEYEFSSLCLHYERVWASGVKANPDRVYYSADFNPEGWSGVQAGYIDIPTWDGASVKAVRTLYNDVIVFKDNEVYRIYGTYPGEYEVAQVYGVKGPIAARSIVSTGDAVYFLGKDGLCSYDGMRVKQISDNKLSNFFSRMNKQYAINAVSIIFKNKLYIALPIDTATKNSHVIEVDLKRQTYMIRDIAVSSFLEYDDKLLFCNSNRFIYAYDDGDTYDGTAISSYWKTPKFDLGAKNAIKTSTTLYVRGKGTSVSGGACQLKVTVIYDGKSKQKYFTLPETEKTLKFRFNARGRYLQWVFENTEGCRFYLHAPSIVLETDQD